MIKLFPILIVMLGLLVVAVSSALQVGVEYENAKRWQKTSDDSIAVARKFEKLSERCISDLREAAR